MSDARRQTITVAEYRALRNSQRPDGEWVNLGRVMAMRLRARGLVTVWHDDIDRDSRFVGVRVTDAGYLATEQWRRDHRR